jgi:hypothetical protein
LVKDLEIDNHGRIVVKRILSNNNKPLNQKYEKNELEMIRLNNQEIERQYRGGKSKKSKNKRYITKRYRTKRSKNKMSKNKMSKK